MKKASLLMSTAILLSVNGNCQWYNRRYGVNDIITNNHTGNYVRLYQIQMN